MPTCLNNPVFVRFPLHVSLKTFLVLFIRSIKSIFLSEIHLFFYLSFELELFMSVCKLRFVEQANFIYIHRVIEKCMLLTAQIQFPISCFYLIEQENVSVLGNGFIMQLQFDNSMNTKTSFNVV